jgi:hypothetical protein
MADYNILALETIKTKIEAMNKTHHIEVLKILKKNNLSKLNENKSGIFVNLSFLSAETIDELQQYIHYIEDQETSLLCMETQKEEYKNTYFSEKGNKEVALLSSN